MGKLPAGLNALTAQAVINRSRSTLSVALIVVLLMQNSLNAEDHPDLNRLIEQGQLDAASIQLRRMLQEAPGDPALRFTQGIIAERQGDLGGAETIYAGLIKSHPAMIEPYNNLALLHAREGKYKSAIAILEKGLQSSPSLATTYSNLTAIYARLASAAYRRALDSPTPLDPLKLAAIGRVEAPSDDLSCGHPPR